MFVSDGHIPRRKSPLNPAEKGQNDRAIGRDHVRGRSCYFSRPEEYGPGAGQERDRTQGAKPGGRSWD